MKIELCLKVQMKMSCHSRGGQRDGTDKRTIEQMLGGGEVNVEEE